MKTLLIILGSPVWLPVIIALFAIVISLAAVLWSLVISVWAVFISFAVSSPAAVLIGVLNLFSGNILTGLSLIGGAMALAGLAILSFFGSIYSTKGSAILTKKSFVLIKNIFER
ncbi:MAG: hypothetical protein IKC61_02685 [Clostridia bacterium]|nr:hypothetical protein [Clostridia bacterium]